MIAWVNGTLVHGSPEEIAKYRQLNNNGKSSGLFRLDKDSVPEHVKKYGSSKGWESKESGNIKAWF